MAVLAGNLLDNLDVEREIGYLEKHAFVGHMAYADFRRCGLPLGSGAIESAFRRVANLRLKGKAMLWL